jgi:hypothetical protein
VVLTAALVLGGISPAVALADDASDVTLTATLDGRPIPLSDVSKYFCDDFAYPEIRCSTTQLLAAARATTLSLLGAVDYVTIYDQASYGGTFMNVSEDYAVLSLIGWNDKISSIRGRNSETGRFWTDWFYGGTPWAFCCNQQIPNLYSYNNVFSSIQRT